MSNGSLRVRLFAAGELVPPTAVFDAVSSQTADIAHTASFFWQGKIPAAAFFTAIPFGMRPLEHQAWLRHSDGEKLWNHIYAPFNLIALSAGNTGMGMGGWFRKPIKNHDDLLGLTYRMPGIGGEIFRQLGANVVQIPPGEIFGALANGTIDGAEFLGPWSDMGFGFFKFAPYYAYPGFHEPNGTSELLINQSLWNSLSQSHQNIIREAALLADTESLSSLSWNNAHALNTLKNKHNVSLFPFPQEILSKAHDLALQILNQKASQDQTFKKVWDSYQRALINFSQWSRVSERDFLLIRDSRL
jgi:TRAP-type mannitol/chloroaromatic compound transport system substrate-binding protein